MINEQEQQRLAALAGYHILDTVPTADFDNLVALAAAYFDTPIATVTILDETRQWFKASVGLNLCQTERDISFCQHVLYSGQALIVNDAQQDPQFSQTPLVTGNPHIRAYVGVPIIDSAGYILGTFCLIDHKARAFDQAVVTLLEKFAFQAMRLIELHRASLTQAQLTSEVKQAYNEMMATQNTWMLAMDATGDGVWDCNIADGKTYFGPNWLKMLGYGPSDIEGSFDGFKSIIHPEDVERFERISTDYLRGKSDKYRAELRLRCKDGHFKWVLSRGLIVERDAQRVPVRIVGTHTDISHYKQLEETIWRQANVDYLTNLPNRRYFLASLEHEIKRAKRHQEHFALFFIDLDDFKQVNDEYGHAIGDKLLVRFTKRIQSVLREADVFARLAGDEFNIIQSHVIAQQDVITLANKVKKVFEKDFVIAKHRLKLSASIGISLYPKDGDSTDTLLNAADKAMYHAKSAGKDQWCFYQP